MTSSPVSDKFSVQRFGNMARSPTTIVNIATLDTSSVCNLGHDSDDDAISVNMLLIGLPANIKTLRLVVTVLKSSPVTTEI